MLLDMRKGLVYILGWVKMPGSLCTKEMVTLVIHMMALDQCLCSDLALHAYASPGYQTAAVEPCWLSGRFSHYWDVWYRMDCPPMIVYRHRAARGSRTRAGLRASMHIYTWRPSQRVRACPCSSLRSSWQ